MAKTGETCEKSGIYKCAEHPTHEITMINGNTFPPCDVAGPIKAHAANWVLVKATHH